MKTDETNEATPRASASKPGAMDKLWAVIDWVMNLRAVRANTRYGYQRGWLLSGGIAYSALFALGGALTIGLTVFSYTLGQNPELMGRMEKGINSALPGILKTEANPNGLVAAKDLVVENPFNLVTLVALLVMLWSTLSLMGSLRTSIQAMFGLSALPRTFVVTKAIDLAGIVMLAFGLVAGILLVSGATQFSQVIFEALGISGPFAQFMLQAGSFVLAAAVDMAVFAFLIRVVAGARVPGKDLAIGTLVGAIASSLIRVLGTTAVGSVANNPILAPFAALATIMLWVNLVARITLLAAAVCANPPKPADITEENYAHLADTPNYVTLSAPQTLDWKHDSVTGVVMPLKETKGEKVPEWMGWRAERKRKAMLAAKEKLAEANYAYESAKKEYEKGARTEYAKHTHYSTKGAAS
ncbi:membrane protein [Arcanobacterium wilhelmae]|uniref:Membrane protein n=1 Tax=Arcanobacterium wilhelmae TaxID=1803177 RepID=A0ABT9NCL2_9ACTO|nr:YihY/virulence factor BrkB family protein [Arcanobacterium wilhelmae]MDP9801464.1 membrane protein [Arcanobacterium wilhelmae]WFN90795.1 YihY/virulence factor BrkB family protein [Arcanobacterium wilhelmae]